MKRAILFIFIFSFGFLFSQVNFELDFSFEKINQYDDLVNLQAVDTDQNGESEIICFFQTTNGNGRMVIYDNTGVVLFTQYYSQIGYDESFLFGALFCEGVDNSILTAKKYDELFLKLELRDFETASIIDSCVFENYTMPILIGHANYCLIKQFGDDKIIYLGVSGDCIIDAGCTFIFKFLWNDQNEISSLDMKEEFGLDYCEYLDDSIMIVLDDYSFYLEGWVHQEFNFALMTHEMNSSFNNFYCMSGSRYNDEPNFIYDSYPTGLKILNKNDEHYAEYGLLVGLTVYDSDDGDYAGFRCFEPDVSATAWTSIDSQIGIEPIFSSTCIPVNSEDHYVMYFRSGFLKIRDRIDGDIIHHQSSPTNPFVILKDQNSQLLFFTSLPDETGYEVFILAEEIQVSAEHKLPEAVCELYNFPNPFNPTTTISFILTTKSTENTEIEIYNIKGQKIKTFSNLPITQSPNHQIVWDGTDQTNKVVGSGIYFYQLKVDGRVQKSKKMMLIK